MININKSALKYDLYEDGQENIVSDLVWGVFSEYEAPDYSDIGVKTFKEFIDPKNLAARVKNDGFKVYCCFNENALVGVIALRDTTHISLLFVRKDYHRRGIAKELLKLAITDILKVCPKATEITVNSSPYSVKIYEKLGFVAVETMQEKNGIKYTPMKKYLD